MQSPQALVDPSQFALAPAASGSGAETGQQLLSRGPTPSEDEELDRAFEDITAALKASKKMRAHGRVTPSFKSVAQEVGKVSYMYQAPSFIHFLFIAQAAVLTD